MVSSCSCATITAQMGPVWTVHMHTEASGDGGGARGQWQDAIPTSITTQRSSIAARCGHLLVARKWASVLARRRFGVMAKLCRAALQPSPSPSPHMVGQFADQLNHGQGMLLRPCGSACQTKN